MIALMKPEAPALVHTTEADRVRELRALLGGPDPALQVFPDAIRSLVFARHDHYVKPLFEKHWPEALTGSTNKKLRFLSCNLYATAPYTVLFSSPRPPFVIRTMRAWGSGLGFGPPAMARWGARAVTLAARFLDETVQKRIVQIASFIATIDHVMDKELTGHAPADRAKLMHAALYGPIAEVPTSGPLAYLRALKDEMGAGIADAQDQQVYAKALARIDEFLECEVKAMTGVPDPSGASWRMGGVWGTIDGLIFPVHRHAGETARQWMYDVSLFVQVMDDWIDLDKDKLDVRETPCITGVWTYDTVKATWQKTLDGIVALAKESGVHNESYLAFVRETYRMMTAEVMEAMCKGSAA
jgi:hypothetical protein